jgi:hypothetical protein
MNPTDDITNFRGDDRRFDLLVDGELSEADRRALLSQLDEEPDGWRRCALAFLESQSWRKEFGQIVRPPVAQADPPQPAARRRWRQPLGTLLAMAASFFLALALGTHLRDGWNIPAGAPTGGGSSLADGGKAVRPEPFAPLRPGPPQRSPEHWEMVTVASPGAEGRMETVQVPAIHRDALDPKFFEQMPGAMPTEVLQAFERLGNEVQQHRELVPMQMNDGSHLVVPVDRVDVHYVGRPAL